MRRFDPYHPHHKQRVCSSTVEHLVDIQEAVGSTPTRPTTLGRKSLVRVQLVGQPLNRDPTVPQRERVCRFTLGHRRSRLRRTGLLTRPCLGGERVRIPYGPPRQCPHGRVAHAQGCNPWYTGSIPVADSRHNGSLAITVNALPLQGSLRSVRSRRDLPQNSQ